MVILLVKRPIQDQVFFQKVVNYGVGAAKVGLGIAEGLGGNPAGFVSAAGTFGNMVNDKMDGRL